MTPQTVLGHLALHYAPGDEHAARRLLELLGATLVDNGPAPGSDGFCTVLIDEGTRNHADNIMFLSGLTAPQLALEQALAAALNAGTPEEDPALSAYRAATVAMPESISHIGLRYATFEALETVLAGIDAARAPGGELAGRIELVKYTARPGLDPAVDARIAASPAFTGDESPAFADYWVQCFVKTDLCGFGILAFGQTFELDFVFEPFFASPPTFGRPAAARPVPA